MRITVILLFVALFQMVAVESSYSQSATISVKAEQIFLTDLFSQIEHQSEFLFFYVDEEVKNIKVNIQIKNKQIDEVLSQALVGTDLTYTINDRNINITRKTYATQQKQTKHITGKITDVNGEPIIGANVIEKERPTVSSLILKVISISMSHLLLYYKFLISVIFHKKYK